MSALAFYVALLVANTDNAHLAATASLACEAQSPADVLVIDWSDNSYTVYEQDKTTGNIVVTVPQ